MQTRAVVFDIGNVLIEWAPERFYDAQIGQARREAFFAEVPIHDMNLEVDRGADLASEVGALARAHPRWAKEIGWWQSHWLEMASPAIDHSMRLMRALQARGVPVLALSNFGISTFEIARNAYPILIRFDRAWISGHLGLIKPDVEFYERLEQESGFAPQELLFTDDRPENIETARTRGWNTHLFDGPSGWAQCLVKAQLLSENEAR